MKRGLLFLVLLSSPAAAQQVTDDAEIVHKAIHAVREQILPEGSLAMQRGFFGEAEFVEGERLLQRVASEFEATQFANLKDVVNCDGLPNTCRLTIAGASAVAVGRPLVHDGTANVVIHLRYRSDSERQPVASRTVEVSLVREKAGWTVREVKTLRIT